MRIRRIFAALAVVTIAGGVLVACSDDSDSGNGSSAEADERVWPSRPAAIDGERIGDATFEIQPGVQLVAVTGAQPGAELALVNSDNESVGRSRIDQTDESLGLGVVDDQGNLTFRVTPPGEGYEIRQAEGDGEYVATDSFDILDIGDAPDQSFYDGQTLTEGYQYIETRDGTTLAAMVRFPGPPEDGPYPTVIEYSGYNPAEPIEYTIDPSGLVAGIEAGAQPSSAIWALFGYATVGVNMRGTGCSGGSFDLFDPASTADGYDIVETVAAQDWVAGNQVGMVGISYPGITQLYTASTQPPSLAAISPLSVTDDLYRGTGYPGGIFNNGFAERWLTERVEQAAPYGQGWEQTQVDTDDQECASNQDLRSTNIDAYELVEQNQYIVPEWIHDRIAYDFVDKIDVPVFLSGAWQDEQTGGHFPNFLDNFSDDIPMFTTLTNGAHVDSLASPQSLPRLAEFLSIYVAEEVPEVPEYWGLAPALFEFILGANPGEVPDMRFTDASDIDTARSEYEQDGRVRILFENGAGLEGSPGVPQPVFDVEFSAWPIPETEATTYYFGPGATLVSEAPGGSTDVYTPNPDNRPLTNLPGTADSDAWDVQPAYTWEPLVEGTAVAYLSEPLDSATVMAGTGSVDVYVRSNIPDTDLQVTLTEVRPDGEEVYVQNGWLRASHRFLDDDNTTDLRPYHTHLEDDAAPMPGDDFELLRVQIFPFAHVFQEGSQIRVSIEAPGGDRQRWRFATIPYDADAQIEIGVGGDFASSVVLPALPSVTAEGGVPPCGSLRGQPCRPFSGWTNHSVTEGG